MEGEYLSLETYKISPCHTLLAYALDSTGDEVCDIFIKDVKSGKILEKIEKTGGELQWADSKTLFYTILDSIHRPYQLKRHILGTSPDCDLVVFEEPDEKFIVSISKSNSKEYLFMDISSSLTSEVRFLATRDPLGDFRVFNAREFRHQYSVEHQGNRFLVLSDGGGKYLNFRLCWTPLDATGKENWREVIPYDPLKFISGMEPFEKYLVLSERVDSLSTVRVLGLSGSGDLDSTVDYKIPPAEQIYVIYPKYGQQPYKSTVLRYSYTSLLTPQQIWDFDMGSKTAVLRKESPIPESAGYDRTQYVMKRIFAEIPSETRVEAPFDTPVSDKIPISLVYKKGGGEGEKKLYLTGYGSYGITYEPSFDSKIFSALDRGYIYAIAHIRGGGENGRSWYETGKFLHKRNTFTDFIAAADELVKQKYTSHSKMVIQGASAGGLLMGAVLNIRPDICNVALAGVPFVDVINTMMDASIPLTVNEYEEWGNPNDEKYFNYMLSYSPYDNVKPGVKMPNIFIKAGLFDPRVAYWEPAKWVAKLRANMDVNTGKKLVLKTKMGSGHFGASGRYAYLKEYADETPFETMENPLLSKGLLLYQKGDYNSAISCFSNFLCADSLFYRAACYFKLSQFQLAASDLKTLLKKEPYRGRGYVLLVKCLEEVDQIDKAKIVLNASKTAINESDEDYPKLQKLHKKLNRDVAKPTANEPTSQSPPPTNGITLSSFFFPTEISHMILSHLPLTYLLAVVQKVNTQFYNFISTDNLLYSNISVSNTKINNQQLYSLVERTRFQPQVLNAARCSLTKAFWNSLIRAQKDKPLLKFGFEVINISGSHGLRDEALLKVIKLSPRIRELRFDDIFEHNDTTLLKSILNLTPDLKVLSLRRCSVFVNFIDKPMKCLETLDLQGCTIKAFIDMTYARDLAFIRYLPALKDLYMHDSPFRASAVLPVEYMKKSLRSLKMEIYFSNDIMDDNLSSMLTVHSELEHLYLAGDTNDIGIQALSLTPKLTRLELYKLQRLTDVGLLVLQSVPNLKLLQIDQCHGVRKGVWEALYQKSTVGYSIEYLSIQSNQYVDDEVMEWFGRGQIRKLDVESCPNVTGVGLKKFLMGRLGDGSDPARVVESVNVQLCRSVSPDSVNDARQRWPNVIIKARWIVILSDTSTLFNTYVEGASVDANGNAYACGYGKNKERNQIGKIEFKHDKSTNSPATQSLKYADSDTSTGFNGIRFVCDDGKTDKVFLAADVVNKRVVIVQDKDGKSESKVFCSDLNMLQGVPNDLTVDLDKQRVYLSGQAWGSDTTADGEVWKCDKSGTATKLSDSSTILGRTNGIELSIDGKTLYVSEAINQGGNPVANRIVMFKLDTDGKFLPNSRKIFYDFKDDQPASGNIDIDGMRFDTEGNLDVTRNGGGQVVVLDKNAQVVKKVLLVATNFPTNLEFAGRDGKTVVVVGRCPLTAIYLGGVGCVESFYVPYPGKAFTELSLRKNKACDWY
ncbi:hypothetical protein HK098_003124 [Nowakowskiella sp. JEL0407]|nr:hypothetical protein HK098_003124 [Nowakowskiella sp. JEL0407]